MRVLVLIHEYPPVGGGGGTVAQDICRILAEKGHEIQLLTVRWEGVPAVEQKDGILIHHLGRRRKQPYRAAFSEMALYTLCAFWKGLGIIRKWRPDLIHVHFALPGGLAAWALSLVTGVPYVLTAHLGDVPGGVPEKTDRWFRWVYPVTPFIWRRASYRTAVSNYTRQLALRHYPLPIEVVFNGVNLTELDPGEIRVQNPPRVLFVGRFVPQKNPLQVVRSLANLRHLPWQCVMLGDGALRPEVEKLIGELGLQERFILPGWVSPQEVQEWFRQSDILFIPSLSEGLPVVGVQAMAMGLALVLSRVGGCVDLVEPQTNGFLLEKGDADGFEHALGMLLENQEHLLSYRRASRRLAARFDLKNVVESYQRIFTQVCKRSISEI